MRRPFEFSEIFLWVLVAGAFWLAYRKGPGTAATGLREAGGVFLSVLPRMVPAFLLAGLLGVALPKGMLAKLLGEESGWRGILLGMGGGILMPGGPMTQFPVVASLYRAGAAPGPIASYITAWAVLSLNRTLVWELPLMGTRFTVTRLACSLLLPLLVGGATRLLLSGDG
ncbi:MAG: permease [Nitrospinota bacterium]